LFFLLFLVWLVSLLSGGESRLKSTPFLLWCLCPRADNCPRATGLYEELHLGDLAEARVAPNSFDLVLAADAMPYLGEALDRVFALASVALRPGGALALNVDLPASDIPAAASSSGLAHGFGALDGAGPSLEPRWCPGSPSSTDGDAKPGLAQIQFTGHNFPDLLFGAWSFLLLLLF